MKKLILGVLVSGRGSNLQAIIDAIESGELCAEIAIVISNVQDAYALKRASKHGIKTSFVDYKKYRSREDYEREVIRILNENNVELVVLAGYMLVLTPLFIDAFKMRIVNIHPALLPAFPGLHVQKKAIDYGVKYSGCTVHFVDTGVDTGPIIKQAVVPVLDDDTEESLSERILEQEHKIYVEALKLIAEDKIQIVGRRVLLKR